MTSDIPIQKRSIEYQRESNFAEADSKGERYVVYESFYLFVIAVLSLLLSACTAAVPAEPGESAAPAAEEAVIEQWFDVTSVGTETIDCIVAKRDSIPSMK